MKHLFATGSRPLILVLFFLIALAGCSSNTNNSSSGQTTVNLGYFANVTHAVALVGTENGTFQKALGSNVKLQIKNFNVGSTEMQALLAGSIDIAFVGPGPAINAYATSKGQALRIIAGAASGGAAFVVRSDENINGPGDLAGKKLADPGHGGTQDVALRYYLQQHSLKTTDQGGDIQVTSTDNAIILNLFKEHKIDGAWMPEPWVTRLVVEGKGKVLVDETTLWPNGKFTTTDIVVRQAFYTAHPDIVKAFLQGVVDTIQYINSNPTEAKPIINKEIQRITGSAMKADELDLAFKNVTITYDPLANTVTEQADHAIAVGLLKKSDLTGIFNLGPLNEILTSKGLPAVAGL